MQLEVDIKEEPRSDEDDVLLDLPLDCILCSKTFNSVRGLRAHVIAQHSYKSVKRKTGSSPQKKKTEKHKCETCRRVFQTQTDLMVHETCHDKHTCFACTLKFDSFALLTRHRKRCKAVTSKQKYKTMEEAIKFRHTTAQNTVQRASKLNDLTKKKLSSVSSTKSNQETSQDKITAKTSLNKKDIPDTNKLNKTDTQMVDIESQEYKKEVNGNNQNEDADVNYGTLAPNVADEPEVYENTEYILSDIEMQNFGTNGNLKLNELSKLNFGALESNTDDPDSEVVNDVEMQSRGENSNDNPEVLNFGALQPHIQPPLEDAAEYILGDTEIRSVSNGNERNNEELANGDTVTNKTTSSDNTLNDVEMTVLGTEEDNRADVDEFSQDSSISIKISKIVSEATDSDFNVESTGDVENFSIDDETVDNIKTYLKMHSNSDSDLNAVDNVPVDVKSDD